MITLLADVNIEGHVRRLVALMQTDYWRELWDYLQLRLLTFGDVGLAPKDTDARVWETCQQEDLFLLTSNRKDDGPDSLEATIRTRNTVSSLPVFTLSDADRIFSQQGLRWAGGREPLRLPVAR